MVNYFLRIDRLKVTTKYFTKDNITSLKNESYRAKKDAMHKATEK